MKPIVDLKRPILTENFGVLHLRKADGSWFNLSSFESAYVSKTHPWRIHFVAVGGTIVDLWGPEGKSYPSKDEAQKALDDMMGLVR